MNAEIVRRHNEVVAADDDVYVLGDLCLGGADSLELNRQLISSMKGQLHVVLGNHDTQRREEMYRELPNIVEIAEVGLRLKYGKYHFVLSHFSVMTGNLERESLKQMTLNLCGHSHTTNAFSDWDKGAIYHCDIDAHNCYPVNIEVAIQEMNNKVKECISYLDKNDNYEMANTQSFNLGLSYTNEGLRQYCPLYLGKTDINKKVLTDF